MKHWPLISAVVVLLLCIFGALLGWRVASLAANARFVSRIGSELYPSGGMVPDAAALERNLPALRRAQQSFPEDMELADLYFESLLYSAYFNPDDSVEPLREALSLGREMLEREPAVRTKVAAQLGWTLFFADLPSELSFWYENMNRIERAESGQLSYYAVLARAQQDDVEGALLMLERELREERFMSDMESMAVTLYVDLNEYEKAGQHAHLAANHSINSLDYIWGMGRYYIHRKNFQVAQSFLSDLHRMLNLSPDSAYDVALCQVALHGPTDRAAAELLDTAAQSVRYETSRSGLEARMYAELLELTGEARWYERLMRLSEGNPQDYFVQSSVLGAACSAAERRYGANAVNRSSGPPLDFEFEELDSLAQRCRELAVGPYQQQGAEMMLAYSACYSCNPAQADAAALERAVMHLRRALGDSTAPGHIEYTDAPDYLSFIADLHVRALRSRSAEFDIAVNHAVIDFLNSRRSQYDDLLQSPRLEYKDLLRVEEQSSST